MSHPSAAKLFEQDKPRTLVHALSAAALRYPSQQIRYISSNTRDRSIKTTTFAGLQSSAHSLASALHRLALKPRSPVVVYLSEHEDNMLTVWACLIAGLVPCLQPALSAQEQQREAHIAHINKTLGQPVWITHASGAEVIRSSHPDTSIELLANLTPPPSDTNSSIQRPDPAILPDDDAMLFLTSGSTGLSKVVAHTHRSILAAAYAKGVNYGLSDNVPILNWVGFDHVAGSIEMHITPLLYGAAQLHVHAAVVCADSEFFLKLLQDYSIKITFAPNFLLEKVHRDLSNRSDLHGTLDLSNLLRVNSGGESVTVSTAKGFISTLEQLSVEPKSIKTKLSAGFGMSETCAGCVYNTVDVRDELPARDFLDIGYPIPGVEIRVTDPRDGQTPLQDGATGELQIRGPMLLSRYYNNQEATSSSILPGGWFRTGDAAAIEKGCLRIMGRIKDTIIVNGVSYGIVEMETILQVTPGVVHSFCVISPHRVQGEGTESYVLFFSPAFDLVDENAQLLSHTISTLRDSCVKMTNLAPHSIVPIPMLSMERSTLGKLSRSHLYKRFAAGSLSSHINLASNLLEIAHSRSYVAPTSSAEVQIATIFSEVLRMSPDEQVSASSNFFELGGNSVDVIRLKHEIEVRFELSDIPLIRILQHPVLSDLALFVESLNTNALVQYDPIVPLQLTGTKTPIFFVHPGVGEVLIFVNLARYFHNDRPFYAIRARGFDEGQDMFTSMDEMVSTYADAVIRTQPQGPYAIAGYSYGGVIAFEVAKRLEQQGREVKFVGLVNIPPHISDRMHEITYTGGMLNLSYFLGLVSKQQAHDMENEICHLTQDEQVAIVWDIAPQSRIDELQLTPTKLNHWVAIARSLIECGKEYNPGGSVASLDVFYAIPLKGTKSDWLNKQLKPWAEFSRSEPTFTDVPGQHYTLMDGDHVAGFQHILRERLTSRGI